MKSLEELVNAIANELTDEQVKRLSEVADMLEDRAMDEGDVQDAAICGLINCFMLQNKESK